MREAEGIKKILNERDELNDEDEPKIGQNNDRSCCIQ